MKTIGKIKKTCKFCGNEFVVYAGNHSDRRPYDFCSKRCATYYRYKEHSSTPFPPLETIKTFWDREYEAIQRIVLKFIRNFPRVPYEEAINEAFLILAKALRFTQERLKIFARIKGGLITYFFNFFCFNCSYTPLSEIENAIFKIENEEKQNDNAIDFGLFKTIINKSTLKCMLVLKDYLENFSREEIIKKHKIKRISDVDTHIRNAVNHLKLIAEKGKVEKELKLEIYLEEIKNDLDKDVSLNVMLAKYDCSKTCFFDFLRKKGIKTPRFIKKEKLLNSLDDIRKDLSLGMLRKDVQNKYDCSKSTLERLIRRYNLRNAV